VIDPKRTQAAELADIWLAPRVGTDAALALAMIRVLITEGSTTRRSLTSTATASMSLRQGPRSIRPRLGRRARACRPKELRPRPECMPTGHQRS
jgi:anaerobic selenocysteine-containing dehydrogenase